MFVRLSFNSVTNLIGAWEVLYYILTNPSITSVSSLVASAGWTDANISLSGYPPVSRFNASRSVIVRTNSPTNIQASRYESGVLGGHLITFQFQCYDSSQKYYVQVNSLYSGTTTYISAGSGVTPAFTTDPTSFTLANAQSVYTGTGGTLGYDFWFHITDNGLAFAVGNTAAATSCGFPIGNGAYTMGSTGYYGPLIVGQYTRFDACNTAANGWIPVLLSQSYGASNTTPYLNHTNHFNAIRNPFTSVNETAFKVLTAMNASATTTSSAPPMSLIYGQNVALGVGTRSSETYALTGTSSPTTAAAASYGQMVTTTTNRYPMANNMGFGFSLSPIFWTLTNYNLAGGNLTDKTGYAIFNGTYQPGDEFTYAGKTYVLWPLYDGWSNNVGLAIPKE